jgi:hypothetical protein
VPGRGRVSTTLGTKTDLKGPLTKIVLISFELVYLNGRDLRKVALFERKAHLGNVHPVQRELLVCSAVLYRRTHRRCAPPPCHENLFRQATFSRSHFASIHANALTRGFCKMGTSCAMNRRPRGSIQMPKIGKKLKKPPRMSSSATRRRTANEDGLRSHRMNWETLIGTRR